MSTALDLAAIYLIAALGVLLTSVVVEFFDLTVDGSFTLGAAITASVLRLTGSPALSVIAAAVGGLLAGIVTAALWRYGIQPLLCGILVMFALYSVNLHVMRASNVSLSDLPSMLAHNATGRLWLIASIVTLLMWFLLLTPLGTSMRAFARSAQFLQSVGVSPTRPVVAALLISNSLVAIAGAMMAQLQRYSDVSMGEGTLVFSLAAIILGRAAFRNGRRPQALILGAIVGCVAYQEILYFALRAGLPPIELRLLTSALVVAVLTLPALANSFYVRNRVITR